MKEVTLHSAWAKNPNSFDQNFRYSGTASEEIKHKVSTMWQNSGQITPGVKWTTGWPRWAPSELSLTGQYQRTDQETTEDEVTRKQEFAWMVLSLIPAGKYMHCFAKTETGHFDGAYSAWAHVELTNGKELKFRVRGRFDSVGWGEAIVQCVQVPEKEVPGNVNVIDITPAPPGSPGGGTPPGPIDGGTPSQGGEKSAKFMIVGDSISHGMEGDATWRGRIFQWREHSYLIFPNLAWLGLAQIES